MVAPVGLSPYCLILNQGVPVVIGSIADVIIEHLFRLKEFEFYHHDVSKFIHVPGRINLNEDRKEKNEKEDLLLR